MKTLLTLGSLLFYLQTFGQFDFKVNPKSKKRTEFRPDSVVIQHPMVIKMQAIKEHLLDSAFHISNDFDFQFRLSSEGMISPSTSVFILTLKNNEWGARYFAPNLNWRKDGTEFKEIQVDQIHLNQLWQILHDQQLLTLPSEYKIRDQKGRYEIDTVKFRTSGRITTDYSDGILYTFDLRDKSGRRRYWYGNPTLQYKENRHIAEYASCTTMIYAIRRYLGLPLDDMK